VEPASVKLLRTYRYRPSEPVLKQVEEARKALDAEDSGRFVRLLTTALTRSPHESVKRHSKSLLLSVTGVDHEKGDDYLAWADRWEEAGRMGREKAPDHEKKLREWLKTSKGTPLRARVIGALVQLRATGAIPDLIDLLETTDVALREAAYRGLTSLSGKGFPFHPDGSEEERHREISAWREWYKSEGQK